MGGLRIVRRSEQLTVDDLKQKFPTKKNTITEETVALLNQTMENPDFDSSTFLNQLVDYQSCMIDSSASFAEYINAMKFCAYLEAGHTMVEAYKRARAGDEFVQSRWDAPSGSNGYNEISFQASRYRKSNIVKKILTQSDMPLYLLFQAERWKAVALLAKEMNEAPYAKDRINAADKLLMHVKAPENIQVELGIGLSKGAQDMQTQLMEQLAQLSQAQHARLMQGETIDKVQRVGIKTEFVEADIDGEE